jgi:hypothetical protein
MITSPEANAALAVIIGSLSTWEDELSGDVYDAVCEGLKYFTLFEDAVLESPVLKNRMVASIAQQGRDAFLSQAISNLPAADESPLREFCYVTATLFTLTRFAGTDRIRRLGNLDLLAGALDLKTGVNKLIEVIEKNATK